MRMNKDMKKMTVAVVQMNSQEDKAKNIDQAIEYIRRGAASGAGLVVLPEYFNFLGETENCIRSAETIPGPTTDRMCDVARELDIGVLSGSIPERADASGKIRNSSVFISHEGDILAKYSKIHLFDIDIPGSVSYLESDYIEAGNDLATFEWRGIHFGIAICYDLRFPELFRCLMQKGAEVILVPAAFTQATGFYHWQTLVRARAIENQVFLCAANQWGQHDKWYDTFGHSSIIDPWGETVCEMPEGIGVELGEIDMTALYRIRSESPILTHIQPWLYRELSPNT